MAPILIFKVFLDYISETLSDLLKQYDMQKYFVKVSFPLSNRHICSLSFTEWCCLDICMLNNFKNGWAYLDEFSRVA